MVYLVFLVYLVMGQRVSGIGYRVSGIGKEKDYF